MFRFLAAGHKQNEKFWLTGNIKCYTARRKIQQNGLNQTIQTAKSVKVLAAERSKIHYEWDDLIINVCRRRWRAHWLTYTRTYMSEYRSKHTIESATLNNAMASRYYLLTFKASPEHDCRPSTGNCWDLRHDQQFCPHVEFTNSRTRLQHVCHTFLPFRSSWRHSDQQVLTSVLCPADASGYCVIVVSTTGWYVQFPATHIFFWNMTPAWLMTLKGGY